MQNQSSINSIFTIDCVSQSSKRRKVNGEFSLSEMETLKQARQRTLSHYPTSKLIRLQMIEAGFFGCNVGDRVICIYCNLICHQWNFNIDDPCEVHKTLSPNCLFVKSMSCGHSLQHDKIVPSCIDYVNPEKRLASFSTWSKHGFLSIDKLVYAGFFYDGSKIKCFYCNGSFENWELDNHPLAEHVRCFPHCNYARQLCGEELCYKIQRAMKFVSGNVEIDELDDIDHRWNVPDDAMLSKLVADRLDLPWVKLEEKNIPRAIIERCWMDQLRIKNDDFHNNCDLHIACEILQRQIQLIDEGKGNIIIPSISLKDMYEKRPISILNNSNQSYHDLLKTFDDDLQTYTTARQTIGLQFTEDNTITIEREHVLNNRPDIKPSRSSLTKAGWIPSDDENYISKCPHCHMQYYNWKSDDDPLLIHKYLSPLCLFVLSLNPFNSNPIPIRKIQEHYTDEDIENAELRPYAGLVRIRHDSIFSVANRRISFNRFPHHCRVNTDELATYGFYYTSRDRSISCFYCERKMLVWSRSSLSNQYFKQVHLLSQCRYIQQLNDHHPERAIQSVANKCAWCLTEDRSLLALPCRDFCLCKSCGQVKRLCPICNKDVTAYVTVYSS